MSDRPAVPTTGRSFVLPPDFEAVAAWWYEAPTGTGPEIWCYTDALSYGAGEEIAFFVHTTASSYSVEVYRDSPRREVVHRAEGMRGTEQATPDDCYEVGCGWDVSFRLPVDASWRSGGYIAVVRTEDRDEPLERHHWFAVRPTDPPDERTLLLVAATSTWIAYNGWGGASHYEGVTGRGATGYSPRLSVERPWSRGTAWLPVGAPRIPLNEEVPPGWVPRYPAMEWALSRGYPKYYAASGWAMYERLFVQWAERNGYRVDVITQHDLHSRPEILDAYRCVVIVGHDEYWTWEMRDHLEAYLDGGGAVARFAGNYLWQVRFEEEGRVQRCHKYDARTDDPVVGTDRRHLLTSAWEDPLVGRPGALTLGLNGLRGCYAKVAGFNPRSPGGFIVHRPDHWAFAGTDLYYGDMFGGEISLLGYEVDGLDYTVREGLPVATDRNGPDPETIEILAMGLAAFVEEDHGNPGTFLYAGSADAEFAATLLYGDASTEHIARANRGSGMVVTYRRGDGLVFNAGSTEWVHGLEVGHAAIETITRNVLDRFLAGVR